MGEITGEGGKDETAYSFKMAIPGLISREKLCLKGYMQPSIH